MSQIITRADLQKLAADFARSGGQVAAPVETGTGRVFYRTLTADETGQAILSGAARAGNSIKEFFFPRHELLCSFVRKGDDVELSDAPAFATPQLVLGCRPCEAASLTILDPVFAWDYQDRFFQSRREKTTVVTIACSKTDGDCFCSAVGGAPDNTAGSDAILFELGGDTFEVRILTEKGEKLFGGKTTESQQTGKACDPPVATFDAAAIQTWVDGHFTDDFWNEVSLRCVGCGACTAVCPTCHCFDIIDEGSFQKGKRVKNWDFCQAALFTQHASGHNPRPDQGARQRQRISHKFAIYPEKFGVILCTGCGNCSRHCAAALGVKPILEAITAKLNAER